MSAPMFSQASARIVLVGPAMLEAKETATQELAAKIRGKLKEYLEEEPAGDKKTRFSFTLDPSEVVEADRVIGMLRTEGMFFEYCRPRPQSSCLVLRKRKRRTAN